jgi:hypothetical protein
MRIDERRKLLQEPLFVPAVAAAASVDSIQFCMGAHVKPLNLTPAHYVAFLQRSEGLGDTKLGMQIANKCVELDIPLPLEVVRTTSLRLLTADKSPVCIRLYKNIERLTDTNTPQLMRYFLQFLYKADDLPWRHELSSYSDKEVGEEVVRLLLTPESRHCIHLSHFNCLVIEDLHTHVAKLCLSHFVSELVVKPMLKDTRLERYGFPSNQDIKTEQLTYAEVTEIYKRSNGLLILVGSPHSREVERKEEDLIEYLALRHGISNSDNSKAMVLTKRESMINNMFSALKVSANMRRGGMQSDVRNPVTIYVSSTELVQSLLPALTHMENIEFGRTAYRYRDPIGDTDQDTLRKILHPNYDKLLELQHRK